MASGRLRRLGIFQHRDNLFRKKSIQKTFLAIIAVVLLKRIFFTDITNALRGINKYESEIESETKFEIESETKFEPLLTDDTEGEWKRELLGRLDAVRKKCGVLCSINDKESLDKHLARVQNTMDYEFPHHLEAPVNCRRLFELEEIDTAHATIPEKPPNELEPFYTLNGLVGVDIKTIYRNIYLESDKTNVWTEEGIDTLIQGYKTSQLKGATYGPEPVLRLFQLMKESRVLKEKSVLVIGSEQPWLESAALAAGATKVTTLEYSAIESWHPRIETMTPKEFRAGYLNGNLTNDTYDSVLSYSSLEHSELGRYGDALNPWGDILTVAMAWCVTKDDGLLMVDVPSGQDRIHWNAHRYYGKYRWALLTINWTPLTPMPPKISTHGTRLFQKIPQK